MQRTYRFLLVLGLLILMILGLNISNQGLNSLTMEAHKPVLGFQSEGEKIKIFTLGESYIVTKQGVVTAIASIKGNAYNHAETGSESVKNSFAIIKDKLLYLRGNLIQSLHQAGLVLRPQ